MVTVAGSWGRLLSNNGTVMMESLVAARHEAHILADPDSKKFIIWPNDKQMPKLEATWHPQMGIYVTGWQVPMPAKTTSCNYG